MSFFTDNPMVGKTKELGDNLPLFGERDKGKGRPSLTNPSKSQPAAGVVTTGGEVLSPGGGVLGTVIKGSIDSLVGKPVTTAGEVLDDDGQVVGEVQMIDLEEQDETNSNADSGVHGVMEEDNKPDPAEGGQRPETQKKWPELPISSSRVMFSKLGKQDTKSDAGANLKTDPKQEEGLTEMEPAPEPEAKVDKSILAGKRVNKVGNVVDKLGTIFGRVVDGDIKKMVGRMCDKEGIVRSEMGDELGKAELVPESEMEGLKEGPFAELEGCTVTKDAKVVTPGGDVVGRLVEGDGKKLFGRAVDEDGDICDKNGNILGRAERWEEPEEPEVEKKKGPMAGRRVNREGNVVDENGDLIGKLTSGDLSICSGKEIDDDGDVVDSKGNIIGHVSLISDIPATPEPEPEPTESPEEKEKREKMEQDKKLAAQMASCLDHCLDKIRPICKMITQILDKAERTPKEELDEEDVVSKVKPLLEEGGRILSEANGMLRGLDPDGRIAANAKHKTAAREAAPEEHRLAEVLKELTGTVTECIENAKRKVEDMPHAKEELNPLWGLLTEPLFQILAAVGLLLHGVLELVGRLLSGLGLGGLVDNLLGGLGLTRLLESLGLKGVVPALTGKK